MPPEFKKMFFKSDQDKKLERGRYDESTLTEQQKQNQQNARRGIFKHIGENYLSVIPIVLVVTVLYFVHIDDRIHHSGFRRLLNVAAVIGLGLSLFTAGADLSMTRIGTIVGETLFKKRKMWLIVLMTFIIGVLVTVAEPDLKVMASQIGWDETQLIIFVGVGVGLFVVFGVIRIVFNQNLNMSCSWLSMPWFSLWQGS
jgi:hypothetical protein